MKIIDCFIFYNELELLNYRLNILYNIVDYFIIVESKYTFTGKEKELIFNENNRFIILHVFLNSPNCEPNLVNSKKVLFQFFQVI
jgi:hypothetical protein